MSSFIIEVKNDDNIERLDLFLSKRISSFSRSFISKMISNEKILVNISDSYTYLLENKDNILNDTQCVVDYVIKVEEREKNEAKKHRIEKGIILI